MSLLSLMHRLDAALDLRRECIEKLASLPKSTANSDIAIREMWLESLRDLDRIIETIKLEAARAT